jgi:hypothetical protein
MPRCTGKEIAVECGPRDPSLGRLGQGGARATMSRILRLQEHDDHA